MSSAPWFKEFWSDTRKIPNSYALIVRAFFEVILKSVDILRGRAEIYTSASRQEFSDAVDLCIKAFLLVLIAAPTFTSEFGLPSTIGFSTIGNFSSLLILLVGSLYFVTFGIFSALSANVIGDTYISPFAPCTVVLNAYTAIIGIGMIGHLLHSLGMLILTFVMGAGLSVPQMWIDSSLLLILQGVGGLIVAVLGIVLLLRLYGFFIRSYACSLQQSIWVSVLIAFVAGGITVILWLIPFVVFST